MKGADEHIINRNTSFRSPSRVQRTRDQALIECCSRSFGATAATQPGDKLSQHISVYCTS